MIAIGRACTTTRTAMCPSCHDGPCSDSSRRDRLTRIELIAASRVPAFDLTIKELREFETSPRYQNQQPRSPKPRFRKR